MSKKNKKQIKQKPSPTPTQSSVSFSLSKWFNKIVTTHPSALIIAVIVIGYALFLLGGGLFNIATEGVLTAYYYYNKIIFLYPGVSGQFISDTVISAMLYLMGFIGLLSIYQSTKNGNKPKQAYMLLVAGAGLVVLSYVFLESAISIKAAGL
jgi:hypothetical protein